MFEMLQEQPHRDREWPGAVLSRGGHLHYFWSEENKKILIPKWLLKEFTTKEITKRLLKYSKVNKDIYVIF